MKRMARRDSPIHKRYRRDDDSNGRDSNSYRGYGMQGNRSRPMQHSPAYERPNPRIGTPSFSRSHRDYVESGRHGGSGSYRSGPSVRRFSQRSPGNSGGTRTTDIYSQTSHSDRLLQSIVGTGDLVGPSGSKIDPVFAAAAAAALNATLSASNPSSSNMYTPNSSAVAAVAAAAMNAAAIAAAIGGRSNQSNGSSGPDFQLPGLSSQQSLKGSGGGNRSSPYERRGAGSYHGGRTRERDSPQYRNDSRRTVSNLGGGHPSPEDDPSATRTLFVGNLPPDIRTSELHQIFDVYGIIEEIDIKRQTGSSNEPAYAFLKFVNVSMAYRAKLGMTGKRIDGYICKVGYGKVTPTRCLWVGGLGPWANYPMFASLVERISRPKKIVWPSGKGYANILYHSVDAAAAAAAALRGCHVGTGNHRIRVDFTDESHMINSGTIDSLRRGRPGGGSSMDKTHRFRRDSNRHQRSASRSPLRPTNRRSRSVSSVGARSASGHISRSQSRSSSRSHSPAVGVSDVVSMEPMSCSINEVTSCLPGPMWRAVFVLKKSNFLCNLRAVSGDTALVDQLFPRHRPKPPQTPPDDEDDNINEGRAATAPDDIEKTASLGSGDGKNRAINSSSMVNLPLLRISQRLRLNPPKCEEIKKRMKMVDRGEFCMLLATESANEVLPAKVGDSDNHDRPLSDLINYLASKEAAGVVVVSANEQDRQLQSDDEHPTMDSEHSRVLHLLPPGGLSAYLLVEGGVSCLRQKRIEPGDNFLVILLSKNSGFM